MAPPIQGKNRRSIRYVISNGRDTRQIRSTSKPECFQARSGRHHQRRANGALTADEQAIREQILAGPTPASPRIAENNMATKQKCFVCGFIDTFSGMQVSQPSVGHLDNVVVSE